MEKVVIPGGLVALIRELTTTGWPSVRIELPGRAPYPLL